LSAQAPGAWGTIGDAVPGEAIPWSENLAGAVGVALPSQCRHRCSGQQDGSHGVGLIGQRRNISASVAKKQFGSGCAATGRMSFLQASAIFRPVIVLPGDEV